MGPIKYAMAAGAIAAATVIGVQAYQLNTARAQIEAQVVQRAAAQGALRNCSARLENIMEAEARNATIPDDLLNFDIPRGWLLGTGDSPAPD